MSVCAFLVSLYTSNVEQNITKMCWADVLNDREFLLIYSYNTQISSLFLRTQPEIIGHCVNGFFFGGVVDGTAACHTTLANKELKQKTER